MSAVSSSSPYMFHDEALPPQAHNAHIAQDPISGLYLLYHIHVPDRSCIGPLYNCSLRCVNGSTPPGLLAQPQNSSNINWTINSGALHTSESLTGPWVGVNRGVNVGCNNPSPFFHPNGSVIRACAGGNYIPRIDTATSYLGPYMAPMNSHSLFVNVTCANLMTSSRINVTRGFHQEDATIWMDRRGNLHTLTHQLGTQGIDGNGMPWVGTDAVHAYSADGGASWNCSDVPPYNGTIVYDDGMVEVVGRRERPKVLLNSHGEPQVLFTAIQPYSNGHVDDYSFTLASPISVSNV